jgi:hypothetical protein
MEQENIKHGECCGHKKSSGCGAAGGGCIYGMAFIGALVYYIQHAHNFMEGLIGVLKALVWPAILIYKLLELLVK